MSVSVAIVQTTLALRDLLIGALRRDTGWTLAGGLPRVSTLPHGKPDQGSGERLNLAVVAVEASRAMAVRPGGAGVAAYDLRFLITAHVFQPLHSELLIGAALQALVDSPVIQVAQAGKGGESALEAAINSAQGIDETTAVRLTVRAAAANEYSGLRLPALVVDAAPIVAQAAAGTGLLR